MSEKEEDHRRKELALEEKHSRDLAKKSQSRAEEMAQRPPSGEVSGEEGDGRGALGVRGRTSSKVRQTNTKSIMYATTLGYYLASHLVASMNDVCSTYNTTITNTSIVLMIPYDASRMPLMLKAQASRKPPHGVLYVYRGESMMTVLTQITHARCARVRSAVLVTHILYYCTW